ncbi:MAG: O-antigen ligase family protein, partial [Burkholderiales bacterium]
MIAALKEGVLPFAVWAAVMGAVLLGMLWRAELPVFLFAVLSPLPTLWYPTHEFTFGKDTQDLLVAASLLGAMINKGGLQRTPQLGWILAIGVYTYLSLWNCALRFGLDAPVSQANPYLADWKNYVLLMLVYVAAYNAVRTEAQVRVLVTISVGVLLFMVQRELNSFVAGSSFSYGSRANGPFWIVGMNANHFGAFVAHFGAFALGLALMERQPLRRAFYLAAFVGSLYPLLFSYSRGAYVALLAAMTVYGLTRHRWMLGVVALLAIVWQGVLPESVVERITMTESEDGQLEESAAGRVEVWEHARMLFLQSPVFGIGLNGFMTARAGETLTDTHNYYLKVAAEQGVVGVALLFGLLISFLLSAWKLQRDARTPFARGLGYGGVGMMIAAMATNAFGDRFSQLALGSTLFLMMAAIERMRTIEAAATDAPRSRRGAGAAASRSARK